MSALTRLWQDQRGSTTVASTILVTTMLSLGALVGLVTIRDHVVQQFGDVAVGLDQLDQSYQFTLGVDGNGDGDVSDPEDCFLTGGFTDTTTLVDEPGDAPACLNLTIAPSDEG